MELTWHHKAFDELTTKELYRIIQSRVNVFVNEQQCFYPELDDKDFACTHLWAECKGKLLAYARLVPPGLSYPEPSIGRILVNPNFRGSEYGKILLEKSIALTYEKHGATAIQIGAQVYLKRFYNSFGFEQVADSYLDYGIPHIDMLKP